MGNAASTLASPQPAASVPRRQPRASTLNEKLGLLTIEDSRRDPVNRAILSLDDPENVDASATEQFVRDLLKDSKNRLGLSALSTNNPAVVLEKTSVTLRDQQLFNITIPHEGSPVRIS